MGSVSKNMNGVSFENKELLKNFQCGNCHLFLDDKDVQEENYNFWFSDYANRIEKLDSKNCEVSFWLKGVDHLQGGCPERGK